MRKKTIVILYILSIPFLVIAVIASLLYLLPHPPRMQLLLHPYQTTEIVTFIVTIFVASLLGIIAWIGTLIKQVRLKQWGWFICTVLFTGIAMLIYLLTVPETSPQVLGPGNGQIYQSQPPMYYPPSQPSYPPVTNDPKWQ